MTNCNCSLGGLALCSSSLGGADWLLTDFVVCYKRTMVPGNDWLLLDWGPSVLTDYWQILLSGKGGLWFLAMTDSSLIEDLGADWQSNWLILLCVLGGLWFLAMTDSSLVEDLGADWQSNWQILWFVSGGLWFLAMTDSSLIEDLTHLVGPLTEETVVRCLQAKFYSQRFQVSLSNILNV